MCIRAVVAEDNPLMRAGIDAFLSFEPGLEIVGAGGSYPELMSCVDQLLPDVVVTDIRMPPTFTDEGIRAATLLRRTHPSIGVVVLSQFVDPTYLSALVADGSNGRGYLLKERISTPGELSGAIHEVAAGRSFIDPLVVDALVKAGMRDNRSPMRHLTTRELETLTEMASGKSNAAIAAGFVVTERAVEKHINSIFTKLNLMNDPDSNRRVKAVLMFLGHASSGQW
jgi:DNA-binding NarL/FixJ family response regulator